MTKEIPPGRSCFACPQGGLGVSRNPPDRLGAIRYAIAPYALLKAVHFGWPRTGSGELDGRCSLPVKFAEAFGFGRENSTGTSNLVLSSPDGESGRPVGKAECLGNPKGKRVGRRSFGYFSSAVGRKVTRQQGEINVKESYEYMFATNATPP